MVFKTVDINREYAKDVNKLLDGIRNKPVDEIKGAMTGFLEKYGSRADFVGDFTNTLLEGFVKSKSADMQDRCHIAVVDLAASLSQSNKKLVNEIEKLGGKVAVGKVDDIQSFCKDVLTGGITEYNESMLKIRNGDLTAEQLTTVMKMLLSVYKDGYKESGHNVEMQRYNVGIGNKINSVTYSLAVEHRDLEYSRDCEKNRAQFRDLKAA